MAGKPAGRYFMQYFSWQSVVGFVVAVVGWNFFGGRVVLFDFGGSGAVKCYFTAEIIVVGE